MARVLNLKRADELEAGDIIAVNRCYRKWQGGELANSWTERDYRWFGGGVEYGDDVLKLVHSVRVIGDDAEMMLSPLRIGANDSKAQREKAKHAEPSESTCSVGWEYDVVGSMEVQDA